MKPLMARLTLPFFLFPVLFLVYLLSGYALAISNIKTDQDSLLALKSHISTSDPSNFLKNNWTTETSVCSWIGVTCGRGHNRVTELDISEKGLVGIIPPEIGNLSFLISINMAGNSLHGNLPKELGYLRRLQSIDFSTNNITGTIPREIGNMTNRLRFFCLHSNHITGSVPPSIFNLSSLITIDLSSNSLSGSFPDNICNYLGQSLQTFSIFDNKLQGRIPSDLGHCSQIETLAFGGNNFTGTIPEQIGNLTRLWRLFLERTNLDAARIPPFIFNMSSLTDVHLAYNSFYGKVTLDMFHYLHSIRFLALSGNKLHGEVLSDNLVQSSQLQYLYLNNNNFTGVIPTDFGNLTSLLALHLYSNNFSGTIPPSFGNLHNLDFLPFSGNQFSGPIPSNIGNLSHLYALNLYSNKLTGQIPSSICNLSSLMFLYLSNNNLEGLIPECLGNLSKSLLILSLKANHFHGPLPTTFTKDCALHYLNLNGNNMEGTLPPSLANCASLLVLHIGNNKIQDKFPFWMESLRELRVLVLRSNRFHGTVLSTSKANISFPELQVFDISQNEFTGSLPSAYLKNFVAMINAKEDTSKEIKWFTGIYDSLDLLLKGMEQSLERIPKTFIAIDLSCNKFNGSIPPFIGNLNSLKYLNFSHNSLTGHVPASLANITALESLDLSSNKLVGEIPQELTRLTFLAKLNLSSNNLVGQIPQSSVGQFSTFENNSYMGNPGLCGFPLSKKCKEDKVVPAESPIEEVDDSDHFLDGFTWQAVVLGYGCGSIIGIVLGYFVFFRYGRPRWLVNFFFGVQFKGRGNYRHRRNVVQQIRT